MSGQKYDRAKYIAHYAPQELERGERTIRGTYDEIHASKRIAKAQHGEQPVRFLF